MKLTKRGLQAIRRLDFRLNEAKLSLKKGGFSNWDEEQVLRRLIAELLPAAHSRTLVDIGAGDGIRFSNTYALVREGWRALGVEYDPLKFTRLARAYKFYTQARAARCRVTPANVVPLLEAFEIEKDFSLLSLDIDSYDYWVLDALFKHFRPRLVVTEINEKIPPPLLFVVNFDPDFELKHHFYGHSIQSLAGLCDQYGYALIDLEYNNAFLAPLETPGIKALTAEEAYRRGYLDRPDRREKFRFNENMEALHHLSPEAGLQFIKEFYAQFEGRYEAGIAKSSGVEAPTR